MTEGTNTMFRHFFIDYIERRSGYALIRIYRCNVDINGVRIDTLILKYETANRGATASARKKIRELERN